MSLKVKLKHYQAPGSPHVRVAVFVGRNEGALAHTGELTMREEEAHALDLGLRYGIGQERGFSQVDSESR